MAVIWGLVDQGFSSATNLALVVLAAHRLGPHGLGVVAIGFSIYLIALALSRAAVTQPLVVISSREAANVRRRATRAALTNTLAIGTLVAAMLAVLGSLGPGVVGKASLLIAPWILPALVQDFWRSTLFRDGRGRAAAANDGAWLLVMALTAPAMWISSSAWPVVGCWGLGATAGALLGFVQTAVMPTTPRRALQWLREEAWQLGRWFAAQEIVTTAGLQANGFLIAALVGATALGGLRAVQTVFAPLSLLMPALALPGLPLLSREVEVSWGRARLLAAKLSGVLVGLTMVYLIALWPARAEILSTLFGPSFGAFASLVAPVGLVQILTAGGVGFGLLLNASGRGRTLFWLRVSDVTLGLIMIIVGHALGGLVLIVWCLALTRGIGTAATIWFSVIAGRNPSHQMGDDQVRRRSKDESGTTGPGRWNGV